MLMQLLPTVSGWNGKQISKKYSKYCASNDESGLKTTHNTITYKVVGVPDNRYKMFATAWRDKTN
jgi:hypothetical protein